MTIYLPSHDTDEPDPDGAFATVDEPTEPDEEDLTTSDHKTVWYCGKAVIHTDPKHFNRDVKRWMKQNAYWPTVWYIDDHGGCLALDLKS